jgi:hypothetical protein
MITRNEFISGRASSPRIELPFEIMGGNLFVENIGQISINMPSLIV